MNRFIILVLAMCLVSTSAFAGHVDTYGIGSKAVSMAGAQTAGTDDAFSIYYNPAAMSRLKKKTFAIGSQFMDPGLEIKEINIDETAPADDMSGSGIKDQSPLLIVPHMAYVHPLTDKVAIGVAFYVPYGLELEWNRNTDVNPAAYNTFHSWYMREVVTPSISYKVNDKFSMGFGVSIGRTEAGTERVRYVPDFMTANAAYAELQGAQYKTEMEDNFNYSFNFGLLYELNEKWAFGLTFRSKSNTNLEGDTDVTPDLTLWDNQNVDAVVDIDTPNQLQVGVQYKPTPKWDLNFDITRTWWGSIEDYSVDMSPNFMTSTVGLSSGLEEEHFNRDWKDSFQYRFGAQYKLNDTVDLRAGYYYDPSVVPESTFDVQWPDSDKHIFSIGTGLHFGQFSIDLVAQYIKIEKVTIDDSENLDASYTREGIHTGEVTATASGNIIGYGVTFNYSF